MLSGNAHRGVGVSSIEVGADFLGEAFGAFVDSAAAHHLHVGTTVDIAQIIDELSDGGHAARQGAEHDQQVRSELADELEDFIVGNAAAGEEDGVAFGFEEVGADLAAQLFGLIVAADDEDFAAVGIVAREHATQLVGDQSIQARRKIEAGDVDAVFAVEKLHALHRGPGEIDQQIAGD
jgi:hypothetical protein